MTQERQTQASFAAIKMMLFDVDGVLTDNTLLVAEDGQTFKRFHIGDGAGIKLAQYAGLEIGLISGHQSKATRVRAKELDIQICHTGITNKRGVFQEILDAHQLKPEEVSYMGDDFMDAPLLKRVGLAITVPSAPPEIKSLCHVTTKAQGGQGAVREVIELVLRQSARLEAAISRFELA